MYLFGFSVRGLGAIDILRKGRVTVGEGWLVIIFRYTEIEVGLRAEDIT